MNTSAANASGTGQGRRLPVRWSLVIATVAVLAAIVLLRKAEPGYEQKIAPIPVQGHVGVRVVARNFAVTVKRVKLARGYQVAPGLFETAPRILKPDGIWMSALMEVEALSAPGIVNAQLRTRDGLVYVASGPERPDVDEFNLSQKQLATALPASGAYFFDVPPDRLQGARLQFHWGAVGGYPEGMDHLVEIDLGLDAAAARKLQAEAQPVIDLR
jgi:hypothetical protein